MSTQRPHTSTATSVITARPGKQAHIPWGDGYTVMHSHQGRHSAAEGNQVLMQLHTDEPQSMRSMTHAHPEPERPTPESVHVRAQSQAEQGLAAQLSGEWGVGLPGEVSQGLFYGMETCIPFKILDI